MNEPTSSKQRLLERLVTAEADKPYGVLVQGQDKCWARELEKEGLTRFVDYYHGDQFWLVTEKALRRTTTGRLQSSVIRLRVNAEAVSRGNRGRPPSGYTRVLKEDILTVLEALEKSHDL